MSAVASPVDIRPLDRRRRSRQRTRQSCMILSGELQLEGCIVDQSATGARIAIKGELPLQFQLLRIKSGECHDARLVWRDDKHAGVAFTCSYDLNSEELDPRRRRLRQVWQKLNKR